MRRWARVPVSPLGTIHDTSGSLKLGDQFLFTRKLCPVPLSFWQKRVAERLSERSGVVHVWLVTELVNTVMDCVSHCGQVNLLCVCNVHCVSGVIVAPAHSTGRSRILLETICGHHCDQSDPQYGNSVRDAMIPVSSSVACCLGGCMQWLELLPSPLWKVLLVSGLAGGEEWDVGSAGTSEHCQKAGGEDLPLWAERHGGQRKWLSSVNMAVCLGNLRGIWVTRASGEMLGLWRSSKWAAV